MPVPGAPPMPPAYGQPAPGSVPLAPGYPPPGYGYPPGFAPPWLPQPRPAPPRKSNTGLIVGIIALVVILVVVCTGGLILLVRAGAHNNPPAGAPNLAGATATAAATATGSGQVLLNDPLTSNTNGWPDDSGRCFFKADGYHIAQGTICYAPVGEVNDISITVQAKQVSGSVTGSYGIVFRRVSTGNYYAFEIDGQGEWTFYKVVNDQATPIQAYTVNAAITRGVNASNTLRVVAKGSHYDFYVNATLVGSQDDTTYGVTGKCGMDADSQVEVAYTNLTISTVQS